MLSELYIENIAVIQKADLNFMAGFNVLCGETGVGKSIIIDSLSAVLGGRTSRELIRAGEKRAKVSALFTGLSQGAERELAALGFTPEDGSILLMREIQSDGKSTCRINSQPATAAVLKQVGACLVSIHGQHDGRDLLDQNRHIDYLDQFAGIGPQLAQYTLQYEELLKLNRRVKALSQSESERAVKTAELEQKVALLQTLDLREGEYEALLAQRTTLLNAGRISKGILNAILLLEGADEEKGACDLLHEAKAELLSAQKYSARAAGFYQSVDTLALSLDEQVRELKTYADSLNFSQQELDLVEDRIEAITKVSKKLHVAEESLAALQPELELALSSLLNRDNELEELKAQYIALRNAVMEQALALHTLREEAGQALAKRIEKELLELNMPNVTFHVQVENQASENQARFTKKGTDTVTFLLSANLGEELKPLNRVASGGELSRIMLALKSVLQDADCGCYIFDEIDTGVSGYAASRVAEKLYQISRQKQVICITHLPQIAAFADSQYQIEKLEQEGRTFTNITLLDWQGRERELARMSAGLSMNEAALKSAGEMLRKAQELKQALAT